MSKYMVTDNDVIEVKMYIDCRKKLVVYSSDEVELLCQKLLNEKEIAVSTLETSVSGDDSKVAELAEIEKLNKEIETLKKKKAPSYLVEESCWFGMPDGVADEYINDKGFKKVGNNPQPQFNSTEYNKAFIAILLKRWTLEREDIRLKLIFETIPGYTNKKRVEGSCVENICSLDKAIYRFLTTHCYAAVYGSDKELKN